MANLTKDRVVNFKDGWSGARGLELDYVMVASQTIYKGSFVSIVIASGLASPGTWGTGGNADEELAGIALEQKISAATGTYTIRCAVGAIIEHAVPSVAATSVGGVVYIDDNQTLSLTQGTTKLTVGRILKVVNTTSTICIIKLALPGDANI